MMRALTLVVVAFAIVACVGPATQPGPTGPGTAWPCGYHGVSCGGGMCCDEDSECGTGAAFSTCAKGYCCFVGGPIGADRVRRMQWRAGR